MSETTPRERPILFSGPLVRALLAGEKTMTRRPVKGGGEFGPMPCHFSRSDWARCADRALMVCTCKPVPCPYDADRLWVRETHAQVMPLASARLEYPGARLVEGPDGTRELWYRADGEMGIAVQMFDDAPRWTPGIHMPRWACRLTLDVTGIRVERLHDITEEDARAEGVADRAAFEAKWREIYGAESWDADPFVWCISFRRTP